MLPILPAALAALLTFTAPGLGAGSAMESDAGWNASTGARGGGSPMRDTGPAPVDAAPDIGGGVPARDAGPTLTDAATPAPLGFAPDKPETWKLSAKLGQGTDARRELTLALTAAGDVPGLSEAEVDALLDDPRAERIYGERAIQIVAPSMVAKQTREHVDLLKALLAPSVLRKGADFSKAHAKTLAAVEKKWGVPRSTLVSILMWETRLGAITGKFYVFNVLATQAYFLAEANALALERKGEKEALEEVTPERQAARVAKIKARAFTNLVALVRGAKAEGIDPLTLRGSWAGAIGWPQFMPLSLRWADDGDGDGKIDLFSAPDAIASVGRYLAEHGWAESPEKAVWAYNREDAYVAGTLAWAKALDEAMKAKGKKPKKTPAKTGAGKKAAKP